MCIRDRYSTEPVLSFHVLLSLCNRKHLIIGRISFQCPLQGVCYSLLILNVIITTKLCTFYWRQNILNALYCYTHMHTKTHIFKNYMHIFKRNYLVVLLANSVFLNVFAAFLKDVEPVSYTHLDVYKRQGVYKTFFSVMLHQSWSL